jgi:hypothetical protein
VFSNIRESIIRCCQVSSTEGAIAKRFCSFSYQRSTNASDSWTKHISNQEVNSRWVYCLAIVNQGRCLEAPAEVACFLIAATLAAKLAASMTAPHALPLVVAAEP